MRVTSIWATVWGVCASAFAVSAAGAPSISFSKETQRLLFGGLDHPDRSKRDFGALYATSPGGNPVVLRRIEGGVLAVEAAPRGPLIAVIEEISRPDRLNPRLAILDAQGAVLHLISDVQSFSWESSGRRIAYVTGTQTNHRFDSTGIWILDIQSGVSQRVYPTGLDVHWAAWDENIYIYVDPSQGSRTTPVEVVRYEPELKRSVETSHRGIYFSPDGKYYYRGSYHDDLGGEVFERAGDKLISLPSLSKIDGPPIGIGWVGQHVLVSRSAGTIDVNYLEDLDVGRRTLVEGRVIPISGEADSTILFEKGAAAKRNISTILR